MKTFRFRFCGTGWKVLVEMQKSSFEQPGRGDKAWCSCGVACSLAAAVAIKRIGLDFPSRTPPLSSNTSRSPSWLVVFSRSVDTAA